MSAVTVGLLLVLGVFALRGAMLGITALLIRLATMIAGYLTVIQAHTLLTNRLTAQWPELPPLLLQVAGALLLFVAGAVAATWLIHLLFWLLRLHPRMDEALAEKTASGRFAGAALNSLIAVVLIMAGVWSYKLAQPTLGLPPLPQQFVFLERSADRLAVWALGERSPVLPEMPKPPAADNKAALSSRDGSAVIQQGDKVYRIESSAESDGNTVEKGSSLPGQALLQQKMAGELQQLADNPDKAKQLIEANAPLLNRMIDSGMIRLDPNPDNNQAKLKALKEMINDPEQLQQALNNPALKEALDSAAIRQ